MADAFAALVNLNHCDRLRLVVRAERYRFAK